MAFKQQVVAIMLLAFVACAMAADSARAHSPRRQLKQYRYFEMSTLDCIKRITNPSNCPDRKFPNWSCCWNGICRGHWSNNDREFIMCGSGEQAYCCPDSYLDTKVTGK